MTELSAGIVSTQEPEDAGTTPDAPPTSVLYRELLQNYKNIVASEGVYLTDSTGRRYIDAVGGTAVNIIGHGVSEISARVADNWDSTSFVYSAFMTNPWQEELARKLASITPIEDGRVFFTSGGSEANESAVKLARQYHLDCGRASKWKVISRTASYHGNTLAMLALSGRPTWSARYSPYLDSSPKIAAAYCYRCPFSLSHPQCGIRCAEDLERVILQEGPDTVSAFLVEPISGSSLAGAVPVEGYYERIQEICRKYDVLFIADEVLTGYGRTGRTFAIEHWDVTPDIVTVGKGLGSGYTPIAACVASGAIVDKIRSVSGQFVHGFTYGGMPMACAIGVQVFDYIQEHSLFELASTRGDYLRARLEELAPTIPAIGDIRGLGLLQGVEIVGNPKTRQPFSPDRKIASRIVREAEARGVLFREGTPGANAGKDGDQIQISPPFVISPNEIDEMVSVLGDSIRTVLAEEAEALT
ncbi:aspartate aminotransferase family protein [Rhodococcus sovatensis]|uniref:Aminotransferase class III-fold pyridoxal phosphate-dependent enzyme n=1 Tax=Rhodococcus sovatensis TaxID=1805840 RepID=A0ABZ2PIE8_9NOCA